MRKYIYTAMLFLYAGNIARGQCECINNDIDVVEYREVVYPVYSGAFINRSSNMYWTDFDIGKDYRVIMTHVAGSYICSNPAMAFENFSYGSNNYTADFTFTGNGYGFLLQYVFFAGVQGGQYEKFEFEIKKKILGFYITQSYWYYEVHATCPTVSTLNSASSSTVHGIKKYEVANSITASAAFTNVYSDGVTNFDAGDYVLFNPGFSTGTTGSFEAYIDGCGGLRSAPAGDGSSPESGWEEAAPAAVMKNPSDEDIGMVKIFPNPADNVLNVKMQSIREGTIQIRDPLGRVRSSQQLSKDSEQLDIGGLEPGMYLLHVSSGDQTEVIRFIKR